MPADPTSADFTLADLLERPASTRADADAIFDGMTRLTWGEYRDAAAGLAGALVAAGVAPGDRVGVHIPKSTDAFVAVHAVVRAGATMVPIDPFAPAAYVAAIVDDARPAAIVTTADGAKLDAVTDGGRIAAIRPEARHHSDDRPSIAVTDPAYIIYTSGSTGRPKGIVHTHASALAYARRAVATYELTADDRLANIAPLHFDQSTFELYAAPLAAATTIVVPDAVLRFPASVGRLVSDERVTVWYSVPFAIAQLVERGAPAELDLTSIRWVLFGGESFPLADLNAAMDRLPDARFSNVYGPAEVNQCSFHHLDVAPAAEPVPIGRAWDGVDIALVDSDGADVPDGEVGEMFVAGPTMMDRYWNQPDLTAAAIVERDGRRWYRTGDLGRRRHDGTLEFLGRRDHQVKLRGHRVELEAVELAVLDHPAVTACAAVVDGDRLVAVVEPAPDLDTARDILASVRDHLPRYAVPASIVGIDRMPRTGTGKVDRRAAGAHLA